MLIFFFVVIFVWLTLTLQGFVFVVIPLGFAALWFVAWVYCGIEQINKRNRNLGRKQ